MTDNEENKDDSHVQNVRMRSKWIRLKLTAELLSDAHFGSGSGGNGVDLLVSRDRDDKPVIWASHLEGVLRDAARRLRGDKAARAFFGQSGGVQQRAIFSSLYMREKPETHTWRATARASFDNRAPKDETLRAIEYVPTGSTFVGEVELPPDDVDLLKRFAKEVDGLGSGRASGAGRVRLSLSELPIPSKSIGTPSECIQVLLKNRDPLCITASASLDNPIQTLSFIPGRSLLGALAAWLNEAGERNTATLLVNGRISVSDALPLPFGPEEIGTAEVLPAPLTLQSMKELGWAGGVPWWASAPVQIRHVDAAGSEERLKRPPNDLFVFRASHTGSWQPFRPARRVRLRNGRPDPQQLEPSLFAIEQLAEHQFFLAEIRGALPDMKEMAGKLGAVLEGRSWIRVGRGGAPMEVSRTEWASSLEPELGAEIAFLTLTSDMLLRDDQLRWRTRLSGELLSDILGVELRMVESMQESTQVRGFNGTSRMWRMPAFAIRRGSVFKIEGAGISELAKRAAASSWLGERTHEGFGRFRVDVDLPGIGAEADAGTKFTVTADVDEESVAAETKEWFNASRVLSGESRASSRKPSLSQWFDLVAALDRNDRGALSSRLQPTTAGSTGWKHQNAIMILKKLDLIPLERRAIHARYFVRWLRSAIREKRR